MKKLIWNKYRQTTTGTMNKNKEKADQENQMRKAMGREFCTRVSKI